MFQIRKINSPHALYYSPGRDVAYVGFDNINYALAQLQDAIERKDLWLKDYMQHFGITEDDLLYAINLFVASIEREFLELPPEDADFKTLPYHLKLPILAVIAQPFIGESIQGRRDTLTIENLEELDPKVFYEKCFPITRRYALNLSWKDLIIRFFNGLIYKLFGKEFKRR
ncbi:MAG: hypothetical protein KatS3mg087_0020 [Patescibacteria group bacterium]|nr:MAG: hypothetical protein KatS3mg087_0020 [Patescibacteria group bacterium]